MKLYGMHHHACYIVYKTHDEAYRELHNKDRIRQTVAGATAAPCCAPQRRAADMRAPQDGHGSSRGASGVALHDDAAAVLHHGGARAVALAVGKRGLACSVTFCFIIILLLL